MELSIQERLKDLRVERGLTLEQLAEETKLSKSALGITVLLIEQNANMALKIADQAYVMQTGTITMSGTGRELAENEEVKAAYLGKAK